MAGIEETLAKKVDRRVLRWFGHMEKMDKTRGAGQEWSMQLKWKVDRGEGGLGLVGYMGRKGH